MAQDRGTPLPGAQAWTASPDKEVRPRLAAFSAPDTVNTPRSESVSNGLIRLAVIVAAIAEGTRRLQTAQETAASKAPSTLQPKEKKREEVYEVQRPTTS